MNCTSSTVTSASAPTRRRAVRFRCITSAPSRKRAQARADRIEGLADQIGLPKAALESRPELTAFSPCAAVPVKAFADPDPFQEFSYPNPIAAKRAISDLLGLPLAKLPPEQLDRINAIVSETLNKREVIARVRACMNPTLKENCRVE